MITAAIILSLAFLSIFTSKGSTPVILTVSAPMTSSRVLIITHVESARKNRSLCVFLSNTDGTFDTMACRDTELSPETIEWPFYGVPPGKYTATAVLKTIDGPLHTQATFAVTTAEDTRLELQP